MSDNLKNHLKTIKGNLVSLFQKDEFDVIIQGCNCISMNGNGLAQQIFQAYPDIEEKSIVWKPDNYSKQILNFVSGDFNQLGNYSLYYVNGLKNKVIINVYQQFLPGQVHYPLFLYSALEIFFENFIRAHSKDLTKLRIGIPKIGAGIAGGNWEVIEYIINQNLNIYKDITGENIDITLVEYDDAI